MPQYETIYEITYNFDEAGFTHMGCGIIILIIRFLFFKKKKSKRSRMEQLPLFGITFAGVGLIIGSLLFIGKYSKQYFSLKYAKENGNYTIVEGKVEVLHEQPEGGHDKGDIIVIDGVKFIINYFVLTPAYKTTIAHGGVLKKDAHVRVLHFDGKIIQIDLKK